MSNEDEEVISLSSTGIDDLLEETTTDDFVDASALLPTPYQLSIVVCHSNVKAISSRTTNTNVRARRKSAMAAAAFVAAAVRGESMPDEDDEETNVNNRRKTTLKRSSSHHHTRANNNNGKHGPSLTAASSSSSTAAATDAGSLNADDTDKGHDNNNTDQKDIVITNNNCHSSKKKTALSTFAVEYLKAWMMSPDHIEHPYPTEDEKLKIIRDTGIELKQLTNWFVNNRKRYWKPKVEELRRKSSSVTVSSSSSSMSGVSCNGDSSSSLQDMAAAAQPPLSSGDAAADDIVGEGEDNSIAVVVSSEGEDSEPYQDRRLSSSSSSPSSSSSSSRIWGNKKRKICHSTSTTDKAATATASQSLSLPLTPVKESTECPASPNIRSAKRAKVEVPHQHLEHHYHYHHHQRCVSSSDIVLARVPPTETSTITGFTSHESLTMVSTGMVAMIQSSNNNYGDSSSRIMISDESADGGSEESDIEDNANDRSGRIAATKAVNVSNPLLDADNSAKAVGTGPAVITTAPPTNNREQSSADFPEYSITPLGEDCDLLENTTSTIAICCNGMAPHICNLVDSSSSSVMAKNHNAQPCALCSACRDWNLGEFCPWDLTGLIGDISADVFNNEEANTVTTKNSSETDEEQDNKNTDMEPTVSVNFSVPLEISHSQSAADFMSSMEAWD